jgi:hypothetical protein
MLQGCACEWSDDDWRRVWQVRQQMDAMVSILEQADKEDAAEAAGHVGGGDVFLSNDWTLSPQLSAIYDRINTAVSDLVCCPLPRPNPLHLMQKPPTPICPPTWFADVLVACPWRVLVSVLLTTPPDSTPLLDNLHFEYLHVVHYAEL